MVPLLLLVPDVSFSGPQIEYGEKLTFILPNFLIFQSNNLR